MSTTDEKPTLGFRLESNAFPTKYCSAVYDSIRKSFTITQLNNPASQKISTVTFTVSYRITESTTSASTTTAASEKKSIEKIDKKI